MFSNSESKKISPKFQTVDSRVGFNYLLYFRLSFTGHGPYTLESNAIGNKMILQ